MTVVQIRVERYRVERIEVLLDRRRVIGMLMQVCSDWSAEAFIARHQELKSLSDHDLACALGEQLDNAPEELVDPLMTAAGAYGDQEVSTDQWNVSMVIR